MIDNDLQAALCAGLPPLFEIDPEPMSDGSVCLITPFEYDDGTMAMIFITKRDGKYVLTDGGETLIWLWIRTGGEPLSDQQEYLLDQLCRSKLGLPGYRGELTLTAPCDRPAELADAVFRLGLAMVRVSDLWFLEPYSTAGMGYNAPAAKAAVTETAAKEMAV